MLDVRARRCALRAARVACGLALSASVGACGEASMPEDAGPSIDASADAPLVFYDDEDAFVDARFPGDASCHELIPQDRICCLLGGGDWYEYDGGGAECFVGVPGPFVPPAEHA